MWLDSPQQLRQVNISDWHSSLVNQTSKSSLNLLAILKLPLTQSCRYLNTSHALYRSGCFHLQQLRPAVCSLIIEAATTLIQAFISCRLDYCNTHFYMVRLGPLSESIVSPKQPRFFLTNDLMHTNDINVFCLFYFSHHCFRQCFNPMYLCYVLVNKLLNTKFRSRPNP